MAKTDSPIGESLVLVRKYRAFAAGLSTWSKPLGLSADGCLIVLLLRVQTGASNSELAAALGLNLSTATKIIDRLVSDNLVHRRPDPDDRRRIQIYLTDDGMEAARKAGERFDEFAKAHPIS